MEKDDLVIVHHDLASSVESVAPRPPVQDSTETRASIRSCFSQNSFPVFPQVMERQEAPSEGLMPTEEAQARNSRVADFLPTSRTMGNSKCRKDAVTFGALTRPMNSEQLQCLPEPLGVLPAFNLPHRARPDGIRNVTCTPNQYEPVSLILPTDILDHR